MVDHRMFVWLWAIVSPRRSSKRTSLDCLFSRSFQHPHLVSEIESKGGKWIQLDVNAFDCDKAIEELEQHGQPVDVLINNAGYCIYNPVECFTDSEVRALMETLYFGPSRLIRTAVKNMRQRRFGIIVNMSSGAALESNPSMGAYAAGKGALDCM